MCKCNMFSALEVRMGKCLIYFSAGPHRCSFLADSTRMCYVSVVARSASVGVIAKGGAKYLYMPQSLLSQTPS